MRDQCRGCGRSDGLHHWWCQARPSAQPAAGGAVIDLCEHCAEPIVPYILTATGGTRYRVALCARDECLLVRLGPMSLFTAEPGRCDWPRAPWMPIVNNPAAVITVTGF